MDAARQQRRLETTRLRAGGTAPEANPEPRPAFSAVRPPQVVAAAAAEPDPATDRRGLARRVISAERAFAPLDHSLASAGAAVGKWPILTATMVASALAAIAITWRWPGIAAFVTTLLALLLVGFAARIRSRLGTPSNNAGLLATFALPLVPLFLFGLGIGGWVAQAGLPWDIAAACLIVTGSVAALYLRRLPGVAIAAQWLLWCGAIAADSWSGGIAGLSGAAAMALVAGREQVRAQRRENQLRSAQERA